VSPAGTAIASGSGSAVLLLASLGLVAVVAAIGCVVTSRSVGDWYETLSRAPWNPPSWVFGPAWTVLYILMAVAAWLVAREGLGDLGARLTLALYGVQLALNLGWSVVFFGLRRPGLALIVILCLFFTVLATAIAFDGISPTAAWLLAPYLAWVAYAASLNAWIALAN
jgi:tryptophan-rich sensory protein